MPRVISPGEVFRANKAVGQELIYLYKDASVTDTGDDAAEGLADVLFQKLEDRELLEFLLYRFCVHFAHGGVLADGDEVIMSASSCASSSRYSSNARSTLSNASRLILIWLMAESCSPISFSVPSVSLC